MNALREIYKLKDVEAEFDQELKVYEKLLPALAAKVAPLAIVSPVAIGSTAALFALRDESAGRNYMLKLPRPRQGRIDQITTVIRLEGHRLYRLSELNHQNVMKVFTVDELGIEVDGHKYTFPYFTMPHLDGVDDFDKFIYKHLADLSGDQIITFIRDVLNGLAFLHAEGIVHCDLKPGNILVSSAGVALITDLGYAKPFVRPPSGGSQTEVYFTQKYAHPELIEKVKSTPLDAAAATAQIPRAQLREAYDLFALGRSIQEILLTLREREKLADAVLFTEYQWRYLMLFAFRLLDGIDKVTNDDPLKSDILPGLPSQFMAEIKYGSAAEALEDLEKLQNLYDLEGEIPELNVNRSDYIQVPCVKVPATSRVVEIINHTSMVRLRNITQLGFVSLVYPGATHSRFEHVLGTFAHCCRMIRALWYDDSNVLFRSLFRTKDLEAVLVAALLHDVAQYPMAHDLAEISGEFAHEDFTELLIRRRPPGEERSLAEAVAVFWDVDVTYVLGILRADKEAPLRERILKSLISGPLDSDKMDYLRRDTQHLGVEFGHAIDDERLYRNLTVVYLDEPASAKSTQGRPVSRVLSVAEVGVNEKALVVAQSVWRSRRDMFRQVYWQHTVRSMKAMLAYVVRRILARAGTAEIDREALFGDVYRFVLSPMSFYDVSRATSQVTGFSGHEIAADDLRLEDVDFDEVELLPVPPLSHLAPSDDALLTLLEHYAVGSECAVLEMIRSRRLYKRFKVISHERSEAEYSRIYARFQVRRTTGEVTSLEGDRTRWEKTLLQTIEASSAYHLVKHEVETLRSEDLGPILLVDVPVKAVKATSGDREILWFVEEDQHHEHVQGEVVMFPPPRESKIQIEQTSFDREVGRIRLLLHPSWHEAVRRTVDPMELLAIVDST